MTTSHDESRAASAERDAQKAAKVGLEKEKEKKKQEDGDRKTDGYRLSRRRWAILAAVVTFGFLNGCVSDLGPILSTLIELLELPFDTYIFITQLYVYILFAFALPTAWFTDRFGLRVAALAMLATLALRNGLRALHFSPGTPQWASMRYVYWVGSKVAELQLINFYYCLPMKITEQWFPGEERSLAWTLLMVGPTLGSALAQFTYPRFVDGVQDVQPVAYINLGALAISALALLLGVTRSAPRHAPSARQLVSAQAERQPFWLSIKRVLGARDILLQALAPACMDGLTATMGGMMQDILASAGLSQRFCGLLMACVSVASVCVQIVSACLLAGETRDGASDEPDSRSMVATCKRYYSLQCLLFLLYLASLCGHWLDEHQAALIIVSALAFSLVRFWSLPSFYRLLSHMIAGYVPQATMSAASTIIVALVMNCAVVGFVMLREPGAPAHASPAKHVPGDYTKSVLLYGTIISAMTLVYVGVFEGARPAKALEPSPPNTDLERADGAHEEAAKTSSSGAG